MTDPAGRIPLDRDLRPAVVAIGRITRWKLTEPVRFYLWPVAAIVALPWIAAALWPAAGVNRWLCLLAVAADVVIVLAATAAARASVYSPRQVMTERVEAVTRARLQRW
jgi:hypothetical protein